MLESGLRKVPVAVAESFVKTIRLLALAGRRAFILYLVEPLDEAGWKRNPAVDSTKKMLPRIKAAAADANAVHTVAPLCKRLISQALNETLSAAGDSSIFFLDMMLAHNAVATSPEAIDFVQVLDKPLASFQKESEVRSNNLFADALSTLSKDDFKKAFAPVDLGRTEQHVVVQQEAAILFNKIQIAQRRDNLPACRKLIARYMVQNADSEDNNLPIVRDLVKAFDRRLAGFTAELNQFMAIQLHYDVVSGISQGDIKKAIRAIRKYAHIFQGNPEVPYHLEIDRMEARLYEIISQKGLWEELKKGE
jgi:hypothetical protein